MTPETLPWWESRVIVGALISAVFKLAFAVLAVFDVDVPFTAADLQPVADALVLLVSLVGDAIAAHARVVQTAAPPVTLKRKDT